MPNDKKSEDIIDKERRDLEDALQSKSARDVLWTHVIEKCKVINKCGASDPYQMAKFIARENVAKDLIENIKAVNLDAWFQMVRDNQFDEEGEQE